MKTVLSARVVDATQIVTREQTSCPLLALSCNCVAFLEHDLVDFTNLHLEYSKGKFVDILRKSY